MKIGESSRPTTSSVKIVLELISSDSSLNISDAAISPGTNAHCDGETLEFISLIKNEASFPSFSTEQWGTCRTYSVLGK